ncbi:hypothetical protein AB4561_07345 [Vibrio sp. 10N.222.55.A3]|uniref:hypothetical protein n=1 Tax=unclassified Vibrio TaxID=2614977 RepID=UPI001E4948BB|nr:hypothetical protein [Vibrio sp. F13]MCC4889317.1 hypothetical protein [Vibrio sp. F13]
MSPYKAVYHLGVDQFIGQDAADYFLECFRSGAVVYLNNKHKVEYMDKITQKTDKKLTIAYFVK